MRRRLDSILLAGCMVTIAVTSLVDGSRLFAAAVLLAPLLLLRVARPDRPRLALEIGAPIVLFGALTLLAAGGDMRVAGLPASTATLLLGLWLATWCWTSWRSSREPGEPPPR